MGDLRRAFPKATPPRLCTPDRGNPHPAAGTCIRRSYPPKPPFMKLLPTRGAFAALALMLAAGSALRAQTYDQLRQKWVDNLTGGNYTVTSAIQTKLTAIDNEVAGIRATMVAGNPPSNGYLFDLGSGITALKEVAASRGDLQRHSDITGSYERLAKMARALRTKGSAYEWGGPNPSLAQATRDDVLRGLEWMYLYAYQPNLTGVGLEGDPSNWWELEIGSTGHLGNILCLLSTGPFLNGANGGLNQAAIDRYSESMIWKLRNPTLLNGSGANGAWRARTWTLLGIIRQNHYKDGTTKNYLSEAQARLDGFLAQTPTDKTGWDSEGFHEDGTFLGHRILSYAGGYGAQMIDRLAELVDFYEGTTWTTNGTLKNSFINWIVACDQQMYDLQFFQDVQGRGLTRYRASNTSGIGLCLSTIWVARFVTGQQRADLHALVRHWLDSTPSVDLLVNNQDFTIPQYLRVKDYYDNYKSGAALLADNYFHAQFPFGGTAVAQRPTWAASSNSFNFDSVGGIRPTVRSNENDNGDTPRGGFLGNGSLQVLTSDLDAFANGYYENLEWKRIPGTTVDIDVEPVYARLVNATNYSGGASTGRFGVSGFELEPDSTVNVTGTTKSADLLGKFHARKGWFFFDKEIVALGTDIRRTDTSVTHKIHTNVENRKLRADNANTFKLGLAGNSAMDPGPSSTSATSYVTNGVNRAWISGNTSDSGTAMGYYFPVSGGVSLNYTRVQRTSTTPVPAPVAYNPSANYLMMWISHGVPSAGSYQYVLLPGASEADTNAYAATPPVTVLQNDANAQAVRKVMPAPSIIEQDETLDAAGALFFNDTTTTVNLAGSPFIRSSRKAAVMVEETEAEIRVTVSDVTWAQTGLTVVEVSKAVSGWESKQPGTGSNVTQTYPNIRLEVKMDGERGMGREFVFHKRHEFTQLPLVDSSGDAFVPYPIGQTGADGGAIYSYNSDAVGDYATFKVWHQLAGSYKAVLRFKKSSNRGKVKVYLGETSTPTTQIGSEIDLYSATDAFTTVEIPISAFTAAGDRYIKFQVTGKNASSGGYRIVLDSLEFRPL